METPAPSSIATAVPHTSPAKPTTLQMETPMPSASQLALELGAKLTKLEDGSPVAIVVAEQPPVALAPMIGHMKARMAQLKDWLDDDDLVVR